MMVLDYSDIPKTSKLFIDYINNFDAVKKYYNINFRDEDSYQETFKRLTKKNSELQIEVADIIKNQYQYFHPSDRTLNNVELLKKNNTISVFTGQQLGFFGGPLYTFYKIFNSIKLSEYLADNFKEYNFVPVFWMAGDDHDFEEISNLGLIDKENELAKIFYQDGKEENINRGSVGNLKFEESIVDFSSQLKEKIRETEFSKELIQLIDSVLAPGKSISESFRELIFKIFDDTGLVIFDPQDVKVKTLLKPIFQKELLEYKSHNKDILLASADLEENYHAQVKIKPINLFLSDETGRHLIEPIDNEFRLKGKRKRITEDDMLSILEDQPERFSPNVLLRPICEDYLFNTGFYIAGPGEISYYAQTIPLYEHFEIEQPYIYPRVSATIVESNIAKILLKYNLSTSDFLTTNNEVKEFVINSISENSVESIFNEASGKIIDNLNLIKDQLGKIDINLSKNADNTSEKILHQLNVLKEKSIKGQDSKYEAVVRQLAKAGNHIFPNNNLQERELGIINFVNKYGLDFFDWLYNELDIHEFKHQILEI